MPFELADRFSELGAESAFEVLAAARAREARGHDVVHFEIGQPDVQAPPHVVDATVRALREGKTGYAPAAGLLELRDAVARYHATRDVHVAAEQVIVTPGPKAALFAAMAAVVRPGDEVLGPSVGFPPNAQITRFLDGRFVPYDLDAGRGFAVDVAELERRVTRRTRVLMLNAPHNPTGGTIARGELPAIADFARRHGLVVITDEIYGDLQFDGAFASIAALPEMAGCTIVVDGLSKNFAMPGWRLGYALVPRGHAAAFERFVTHNFSCTSTFVQLGALAALTGPVDSVLASRRRYAARAARVADALDALPGVTCHRPGGAFYAFPDLRALLAGTGLTSRDVAARALEEFDVAVLPGSAFGPGGEGFLRVAFLQPDDVLDRGLERLAACFAAVGDASMARSVR
ncbi:MAG: aminotransferase class I/II-fold pyridoxal phosphate-dependent enzyme [Gemmatimonadota bacterium]|nr:aminotransferase class I/II-fold pyridoxal phosphate-dependent enzyme [Gemmatimonadota bacterium]MDE3174260.1 aminotransferase class I/II-fold pyridoxal phosphate-dependent enzyme [Gemmatimonadota bacterium]